MNINIQGDFQICISVPLSSKFPGAESMIGKEFMNLWAYISVAIELLRGHMEETDSMINQNDSFPFSIKKHPHRTLGKIFDKTIFLKPLYVCFEQDFGLQLYPRKEVILSFSMAGHITILGTVCVNLFDIKTSRRKTWLIYERRACHES